MRREVSFLPPLPFRFVSMEKEAVLTPNTSTAKLSKSAKGRLASIKPVSSGTATSGLATSLAFTPVQGALALNSFPLRSSLVRPVLTLHS